MPCADQAELLRAFDLPIALMQDAEALERITSELVETKAADGVRYVEIRWGPLAARRARASRSPTGSRRCARARRRPPRGPGRSSGSSAPRCGRTTPRRTSGWPRPPRGSAIEGLTGFDLAGPEAALPGSPPSRTAFEAARAGGLQITLHAGEWGGAGAGSSGAGPASRNG